MGDEIRGRFGEHVQQLECQLAELDTVRATREPVPLQIQAQIADIVSVLRCGWGRVHDRGPWMHYRIAYPWPHAAQCSMKITDYCEGLAGRNLSAGQTASAHDNELLVPINQCRFGFSSDQI
jgi:hypothetical protein